MTNSMEMPLPNQSDLHQYIGKHKRELPSPSLCISSPRMKTNVQTLHDNAKRAGVDFRPHLKTSKTVETTRLLLGDISNKVMVSTLAEVHGLQSLISEGLVKDILYGMPVSPSVLPALDKLRSKITVRLLVDHVDHIAMLSKFSRLMQTECKPWLIFIKLDMGSRRAGVPLESPNLLDLIDVVGANPSVKLCGFYSYPARSTQDWSMETAKTVLQDHISGLIEASKLVRKPDDTLTLAIGSSITARVAGCLKNVLSSNFNFEVIAGTAIYNDLQQLSTATTDDTSLAMSIIAEVCSVYPDRNEVLINAGVLALTREPGDIRGIARVRDTGKNGWLVDRVSQEHGIVVYEGHEKQLAERNWKIGDKIELDIQHCCIAGAMFGWHFVTDEHDVVRDIYFPWKWW